MSIQEKTNNRLSLLQIGRTKKCAALQDSWELKS